MNNSPYKATISDQILLSYKLKLASDKEETKIDLFEISESWTAAMNLEVSSSCCSNSSKLSFSA